MSFPPFRSLKAISIQLLFSFLILASANSGLLGQDECVGYRWVQRTVYDQTPVKVNKWITETVNEKQKITTYKPVWKTEKRERRQTVLKPIQETSVREEKHVVRRPVTETELRTENVTVYRPTVVASTQLTPTNVPYSQLVPTANSGRPRARWLTPGYYTDPTTGLSVYRRRGFYWFQQPTVYQLQTGTVSVLMPQQIDQVTMVPEVRQVQKQVQVTRFVESVETWEVPVTTTRYENVEEVVPYEVKTVEWVEFTEEIEVPKTQRRMVEVDLIKHTPRTVMVKVPVDAFGNMIGPALPPVSSTTYSPTLATPDSQSPPDVLLANDETKMKSAKPVNETSTSEPDSVLEKTNESLTPETNLIPIWRPLDDTHPPVIESDFPRAAKPPRSRESMSDDSAADTTPALDSRPSMQNPESSGTDD